MDGFWVIVTINLHIISLFPAGLYSIYFPAQMMHCSGNKNPAYPCKVETSLTSVIELAKYILYNCLGISYPVRTSHALGTFDHLL